MSLVIWNFQSWPLHVSGHMKLPFLTTKCQWTYEIAILDHEMSIVIWNCHSWPLDVSNNLSEYFMSSSVHMHFAFGYHEQHWTVKSWLCPLAFFYRQERGGCLPDHPLPPPWMGHFWASYSLLVWYGIPVHVAVKLICLTIGLWIFLSKDNVLLLLQYDTEGGSICLWCLYLYICTGISLYFLNEQWRDNSVLWQCWLTTRCQ